MPKVMPGIKRETYIYFGLAAQVLSCRICRVNQDILVKLKSFNYFLLHIFISYHMVSSAMWQILPLGKWNYNKIWETSKIFVNIAGGYCAITSLYWHGKIYKGGNKFKGIYLKRKVFDQICFQCRLKSTFYC